MTAAIVSAGGIGDGLLMMIAYEQLSRRGVSPTLFHEKAGALKALFPSACLKTPIDNYSGFDLVILENDNSKRAWDLMRARRKLPLRVFFPTPSRAQTNDDYLFDGHLSVASNIQNALKWILKDESVTKDNGLEKHSERTFQKYKKRIVIHPTSADVKRNWLPHQYLNLARRMREKGFTAVFAVSPDEHPYWAHVKEERFDLPLFSSLKETANYIYESALLIGNDSGLGHLASNLSIPTLTISGNKKRVLLWRPDWAPNKIVTPHLPLPNFKGINFRMRESCWPSFVSERRVLKNFESLYAQTLSNSAE